MKFAVQEDKVPGESFSDKLQKLDSYGYDGIELWGKESMGNTLAKMKDDLSTSRVKASTICSGYPGDLLGAEKDLRDRAIRGMKDRLRWASELGAVGVITVATFGGPKVSDVSPLFPTVKDLERKLFIEELKELAKTAQDVGAYIILEPINRYETHFMNRLEEGVSICKAVGSEWIRIMGDYFHMNIEEDRIERSIREYSDFIVHIHLADSNRILPGYGHTDFSSLAILDNAGYKYYAALECAVPGDPNDELPKSLAYLKKYL